MKATLKKLLAISLTLMLLCADVCAAADTVAALILSPVLVIIEEEAFYGDISLQKVTLPDHTLEIRSKAFANSSLVAINLPVPIEFIAEDAFDGCAITEVEAEEGTYAYDWALAHGLITPSLKVETLQCFLNGDAQPGDQAMWVAKASGGKGAIEYAFEVYCGDALVASQEFSQRNFISVALDQLSAWRDTVTFLDEAGITTPKAAHTMDVLEPAARFDGMTSPSGVMVVGEQLTWTTATTGGTAPSPKPTSCCSTAKALPLRVIPAALCIPAPPPRLAAMCWS